jgi:membrane-associated phospholipid phosphatase
MPVFACTVVLLARQSPAGRIAARRWLVATCAAGVLVAVSKIAFYGWGTGVKAWNLAMPSGHATLALALWPLLLAALVPVQRRVWRHLSMTIGILLGIACAGSRVVLHAHPLSEAVAGSVIGLVVMAIALPAMQTLQLVIPRGVIMGAGLLVLLLWAVPYSLHIPTETWLARSGAWLAGRQAPVARKDWRRHTDFSPRPEEKAPPKG